MPASKAQQKAVTKYVKAKYDRFGLTMSKGNLDTIKAHAESQSESVNGFINRAIGSQIERDCDKSLSETAGARLTAGGISLHPDTVKAAQEAAEATGEAVPQFVDRAVLETAERDRMTREGG